MGCGCCRQGVGRGWKTGPSSSAALSVGAGLLWHRAEKGLKAASRFSGREDRDPLEAPARGAGARGHVVFSHLPSLLSGKNTGFRVSRHGSLVQCFEQVMELGFQFPHMKNKDIALMAFKLSPS